MNKPFTFAEYQLDDTRIGRLIIRWEHANGKYYTVASHKMSSKDAQKLFLLLEKIVYEIEGWEGDNRE